MTCIYRGESHIPQDHVASRGSCVEGEQAELLSYVAKELTNAPQLLISAAFTAAGVELDK